MPKRKASQKLQKDHKEDEMDISNSEQSDSSAEDSEEIIDVDFEFFDPKEIDYHSIKNLLNQLFSPDADQFNLTELTELILSQPLVGTTVKVDGPDSDPYALLTVLNMNFHQEKQVMKQLKTYLLSKCQKDASLNTKLSSLLREDSEEHVGLLISERLINMPVQIVPQMYRMLVEEIGWAIEDQEPYQFDWYLLLTKTYKEVEPAIDDDEVGAGNSKPKKKKKAKFSQPSIFYFHPEDEVIEQKADYTFDFKLTKQPQSSDSRRAFNDFGILPAARFFLIHKDKINTLLEDLATACQ